MTPRCRRPATKATKLTNHAHSLQQALKKVMRGCGRQGRGHGHVFVTLVRHTEQELLELGEPSTALGPHAQHLLAQATAFSDATRERFAEASSTPRCAAMRTSASHPNGSPKATNSVTVHSSILTSSPSLPCSKARVMAPRRVVESLAWCRTPPRACSGRTRGRGESERCQLCLAPPGQGPEGD